jgi:hypothetical protein
METEDKYLTFIKNNDFKGLIDFADELLNTNKNDKTALEYKAKAFPSLGMYNESYNILSSL